MLPRNDAPSASAGAPGALTLTAEAKLQDSTVTNCNGDESTRTRSHDAKAAIRSGTGLSLRKSDRLTLTDTLDSGVDLTGRPTHRTRMFTVTALDRHNNVIGSATSQDYATLKKAGLGDCGPERYCTTATTIMESGDGVLRPLKGRKARVVYGGGAGAKNRDPDLKRVEIAAKKKIIIFNFIF